MELLKELGVDQAVNTREEDIAEAARRFAPDGIDAILALVGGDQLQHAIGALRPDGRVAYPNGIEPEPKKRPGVEFIPYDAVAGVKEFQRLNRAIDVAKLKVPIAGTFPLSAADKAHDLLAHRPVPGKVVLRTLGSEGRRSRSAPAKPPNLMNTIQ
jgi:NADPH2:quinone reductase